MYQSTMRRFLEDLNRLVKMNLRKGPRSCLEELNFDISMLN